MVMYSNYNVGQNHDLVIANKSFETGVKFTRFGATLKNQIAFTKKLTEN
jgi:hypothetical protein